MRRSPYFPFLTSFSWTTHHPPSLTIHSLWSSSIVMGIMIKMVCLCLCVVAPTKSEQKEKGKGRCGALFGFTHSLCFVPLMLCITVKLWLHDLPLTDYHTNTFPLSSSVRIWVYLWVSLTYSFWSYPKIWHLNSFVFCVFQNMSGGRSPGLSLSNQNNSRKSLSQPSPASVGLHANSRPTEQQLYDNFEKMKNLTGLLVRWLIRYLYDNRCPVLCYLFSIRFLCTCYVSVRLSDFAVCCSIINHTDCHPLCLYLV